MSPLDVNKRMTPQRVGYLSSLKAWVKVCLDRKYRGGQKAHGGDLDRKACFPHLGDEIIDSIVYYYEHRRRMDKWAAILQSAIEGKRSKDNAIAKVLAELHCELEGSNTEEVFSD